MEIEKKIINNIIWKFSERIISLLVSFSVTIVLSRLLQPEDYGLVTIVSVFVTALEVFVTNGVGSALIQKKSSDQSDFMTALWSNIILSIVIYILIFIFSFKIEVYFKYHELGFMLRILSLRILVLAINSIQIAYISKKMLFKYYFFSTLIGKIFSGIIGIILALVEKGAWALIFQALSMSILETMILSKKIKWHFSKTFSMKRAISLFSFSWKIILMSFIEMIGEQYKKLLIGKKYEPSALAFYDKGFILPNTVTTNITSSLIAVMYPVLANFQDSHEVLIKTLRKWIVMYAYITFPILFGFMATADKIIIILFSEKWSFAIPYMKIASLMYISWVIEVPIRETIKSIGKAYICLKIQILKSFILIFLVLITMNTSVYFIAFGGLICSFINIVISSYYGKKILNYNVSMLFNDVMPTLIINIIMGNIVFLVGFLKFSILITFSIQIIVAVFLYLLLSFFTKNKAFLLYLKYIKNFWFCKI